MSRKGKLPIAIPKGIEVKIAEKQISVKGPKGTLKHELVPEVKVHIDSDLIHVELNEAHRNAGNFHGLYRSIIDNMVKGAFQGFERKLEMIGVVIVQQCKAIYLICR